MQKTSGNEFLGSLEERVFSYYPNTGLDLGECVSYLLEILWIRIQFKSYTTYKMEHLLWQKMVIAGNWCWLLLLCLKDNRVRSDLTRSGSEMYR